MEAVPLRLLLFPSVQGLLTQKNDSEDRVEEVIRIRVDANKILLALVIMLIIIGGVALRLTPLADSQYPYLTDGLKEARYAEHISSTGTLAPETDANYANTHTTSTPAYDAMIALSSQITGENAVFLIQKLVAPLAILTLLGTYIFATRISNSGRVGLMALMGMAAYGPFLMVTQASWKESLGFALIPFIFLTFYYRDNLRMRLISSFLILFTPFVHHFVALFVILVITFVATSSFMLARKEKRLGMFNILDAIIAFIAIDEMIVYYSIVKLDRLEFLTPENGLYLFIGLAMFFALGIYYLGSRCITSIGMKTLRIVFPIGLLVLVAINLMAPIGLIDTTYLWAITPPFIACLTLIIIGLMGIAIWASTMSDSKILYFSILAAPFVLLVYALIRGDDLISTQIIARTMDFADLGILIGIGSLLVLLVKKRRQIPTMGIFSAVCALLILTVPMALDSEKYLGGRNSIYEFEINGINWADEMRGTRPIDTDEHFMNVRYYSGDIEGQTLPRRIDMKQSFESKTTMMGSERWVTIGVKDLPYGWVVLNGTEFHQRLNETNLLYVGGPADICIYVFIVP